MKNSKRLIVVVVVVALLAVTALSVWASPSRRGTVPVVAPVYNDPIPQQNISRTINFGTGTVEIEATNCTNGSLSLDKIADPATALGGFYGGSFIPNEAVDVGVSGCAQKSLQVCVPQSPDMEGKTMAWNVWDEASKSWSPLPTSITGSNPTMICGSASGDGKFALLGK